MNAIKEAVEALELALPFMEEQATIQGYGFYRPANPHNFFPDPESCTEAEIENHRAACEAYDEGKFVPDTSDGWVSPNVHILKAPWGIGSYSDTIPEIQAQCDKARAALAALRSMQGEAVPYGQITTHSVTGQQFFYRWPHPPYLDTASECVTVYTQPPTEAVQRCRYPDCKCPTESPCLQGLPTEAVRMSEADEALMRQALYAAEKIKPWAWTTENVDQNWDDDCRTLDAAIEALRARLSPVEQATAERLGVTMGDAP